MEIVIYSVLILALAAVAGCMLYVRFTTEREKSLHHSPQSAAAEEATDVEEMVEVPVSEIEQTEEVEIEEPVASELSTVRAEAITTEDTEDERKSEYLDELQEAAAGLAMLMRSSASNRSAPVVFAPEEEEVDAGEEEMKEPEAESKPEPTAEVESETEIETEIESEIDEAIEALVETPEQPEEKTLATLLGAEVTDQIDKIDTGLNELEELVVNIETSLSILAPEEEIGEIADESEIEVSEAA